MLYILTEAVTESASLSLTDILLYSVAIPVIITLVTGSILFAIQRRYSRVDFIDELLKSELMKYLIELNKLYKGHLYVNHSMQILDKIEVEISNADQIASILREINSLLHFSGYDAHLEKEYQRHNQESYLKMIKSWSNETLKTVKYILTGVKEDE